MAQYTTNSFGQSLLSDMSSIMKSAEHQKVFHKVAQMSAPDGYNKPQKLPGVTAQTATPDKYTVDQDLKKLYTAITNTPNHLQDTKVLQPASAALSAFFSASIDPLKGWDAVPASADFEKVLTDAMTQLNQPGLVTMLAQAKAMIDQYKGAAPQATAASILETLIKVADFLGEQEMAESEKLADALISSFVVEAKKGKKSKKEEERKQETRRRRVRVI